MRTRNKRKTIDQRIIAILKEHDPKKFDAGELVDQMNLSRQALKLRLERLAKADLILRLPAPGRGYVYRFNPNPPLTTAQYVQAKKELPTASITSQSLQGLLNKFAGAKWEPKIFNTARNLPVGLARLFELATEVANGSIVDKSDLIEVQILFKEFESDLEAVLKIIYGVLGTEELSDTKKFAPFLIGEVDADQLRAKALKAKRIN